MKNNSSVVCLIFALIIQISASCNLETEDCVEFGFCAQNITAEDIRTCGEKKVCCEKEFNIINIELPTCGLQKFNSSYKTLKLPWSVEIVENGKRVCTGSLINSRVVLTAGQCVSGKSSLAINLGFWGLGSNFEVHEKREVEKTILHPSFVNGQLNDDVALIVLKTAAPNNAFINPICLATAEDHSFEGKSCILLGYEEKSAPRMNIENMIVESCSKHPKLAASIPKNSICTAKNQDLSLMNSIGAGLVCAIDEENNAYQMAGIFLHGTDFTPSVYVNISDYVQWIDEQMKSLGFDEGSYVFDPTASRFFNWSYLRACFHMIVDSIFDFAEKKIGNGGEHAKADESKWSSW